MICKWLPSESRESVKVELPTDMSQGTYQLCCVIGGGKYPVVKLATDTRNDDEKFYMADMEIVD